MPGYVAGLVYGALAESIASEQSARRAAMGRALRELAAPHAAQDIYENLVKLMK